MKIIHNFKYWYKHWHAFQVTAMRYKCWEFRFLFHDIEKPFLQIFLKHNTVSKLHRRITRHHAEFIFPKYRDYIGMVIDWECASLTKSDKQLNARQTLEKYYPELKEKIYPLINKIGL